MLLSVDMQVKEFVHARSCVLWQDQVGMQSLEVGSVQLVTKRPKAVTSLKYVWLMRF